MKEITIGSKKRKFRVPPLSRPAVRVWLSVLAGSFLLVSLCAAGPEPETPSSLEKPVSVDVKMERVQGEEYETCCEIAQDRFGNGKSWTAMQMIDYSLTDSNTGLAVVLDRPVRVDIAPKKEDTIPRVILIPEAAGEEMSEVLVTMDRDGKYSFSLGSSARMLLVSEAKENADERKLLKIQMVAADGGAESLSGAYLSVAGGGDTWDIQTGENGKADVGPIACDTFYTLMEAEAPAGYIPLESPVIFKIDDKGSIAFYSEDGNIKEFSDPYKLISSTPSGEDSGEILMTMENLPVYRLPETGGRHTWLWGAATIFILMGGGILYFRFKGRSAG